MDDRTLTIVGGATEDIEDGLVAVLYERFVQARQAAMIEEIRRACGISAAPIGIEGHDEPDEVAADVRDGTAEAVEPEYEMEPEVV